MSDQSRRKLLKSIAAGGGSILAGKTLPDKWVSPVVDSVILPAHAQTSPDSPIVYAIGDTGPCGGIVFYIENGGLKGMEAAPEDQNSAIWGCNGTATGITGTAIGDGAGNTAAILGNACSTSGIAADIASTYVGGGCTDWFLPSLDELNLMYNNLHDQTPPLGDFAPTFYWSSSEIDASDAWFQYFFSGYQGDLDKDASYRVRAVRGF